MANPDAMGTSQIEIEGNTARHAAGLRVPLRRGPTPGQDADLWMRLLEGQSAVIELLAKGAGLEKTLQRLVRVIEVAVPGARSAIFVTTAEADRLRLASPPVLPAAVEAALELLPIASRSDPLALCARRREPVSIFDCAEDPRWHEFARLALAHGVRACSAQPILSQNGEALAVIALYFNTPGALEDADCQTLDALSPLARVVIENDRRVEALQSADTRFASITASIAGVVYQRICNPATGDIRYTYISEGVRDFFGVSAEEVLTDPTALFACYGKDYRDSFREKLVAASRSLSIWDVETPIIARDGTRKWSHAIARPQRLPDGSVLWSGVILDATRMKEANIALAASSRAKSEFLANMSHELRTPLNAIIGFSDIMRSELLGTVNVPKYKGYIDDIHASGLHLLKVINDILDLAKIEAGKLELEEEVVDLQAAIEMSLRVVAERAAARNVRLSTRFPPALPKLRADERKLKQILLNLLSNAIKFTPNGGSAEVGVAVESDGSLTMEVRDTGIGIAPDDLSRVFDPFFQVDGSLSRRFEGTGLGLALTRAMVELHGGAIRIESTLGKGTAVFARYPRERVVA